MINTLICGSISPTSQPLCINASFMKTSGFLSSYTECGVGSQYKYNLLTCNTSVSRYYNITTKGEVLARSCERSEAIPLIYGLNG
jgi:hypothetical protein